MRTLELNLAGHLDDSVKQDIEKKVLTRLRELREDEFYSKDSNYLADMYSAFLSGYKEDISALGLMDNQTEKIKQIFNSHREYEDRGLAIRRSTSSGLFFIDSPLLHLAVYASFSMAALGGALGAVHAGNLADYFELTKNHSYLSAAGGAIGGGIVGVAIIPSIMTAMDCIPTKKKKKAKKFKKINNNNFIKEVNNILDNQQTISWTFNPIS